MGGGNRKGLSVNTIILIVMLAFVNFILKDGRIIYESSCIRYIRRKEKRGDNAF